MPSKFVARMDDWLLNILDITDGYSQAIAQYEYVGADGSELDNMGARARTWRFKSYWFGTPENKDGFQGPSYDNHVAFLESANDPAISHEFVHPKYGTVYVRIPSISILHDDRQKYCEIDLELIEDGIRENLKQVAEVDVEADAAKKQLELINEQIAARAAELEAQAMGELNSKFIDVLDNIIGQINNVAAAARKWAHATDVGDRKGLRSGRPPAKSAQMFP